MWSCLHSRVLEGPACPVDHGADKLRGPARCARRSAAGAGDVAVAAGTGERGVVGDVERVRQSCSAMARRHSVEMPSAGVGVAQLRTARPAPRSAGGSRGWRRGTRPGSARPAATIVRQPPRVPVEDGEVVFGDVSDTGVGDAELDHAPGAEQLVGQLGRERCRHVAPSVVRRHDVLARQPHQRVRDVRRFQFQRLGQRRRAPTDGRAAPAGSAPHARTAA